MVTVGIDPHKRVCYAAAVDAAGRRIDPVHKTAGAADLPALLDWARRNAGEAAEVLWALEDGRGLARPLADALLLAGQRVVWVPARAMAAHRRLHNRTGAKSDAIDAAAVARAAVAECDLAPHRIDEPIRELRLMADRRADAVQRRTQACNRLRAWIHTWFDHTPADLTRAKGRAALQAALEEAALPARVHAVFTGLLAEVAELSALIAALERDIARAVEPLAPHLLAIPGIGPVSAAVLLGEIGDITRFPTAAKLAAHTGCAPIPVSSSGRDRHRLCRGGNRRLNCVIHIAAVVQKQRHPGAGALVERLEPTKGKRGAYRVLKRHLVDVIYRAMVRDRARWAHAAVEHHLAA
ncbi:transposase [Streptomonospora alba]|uniref:Transposase n=1 Tax=Streptomonospora alba TaxID=183763 RepID=A0A0C2JIW0_9ACTN|nr:IS110 family transposase [Streptomonospora alba]KIH98845.1 transposase [Streptomonospora alba]